MSTRLLLVQERSREGGGTKDGRDVGGSESVHQMAREILDLRRQLRRAEAEAEHKAIENEALQTAMRLESPKRLHS